MSSSTATTHAERVRWNDSFSADRISRRPYIPVAVVTGKP